MRDFDHSYTDKKKHWTHKPEWWPQDEPWPPRGPGGHIRNRRLVRRMGCFFFVAIAGFSLLMLLLGGLLARYWLKSGQPPARTAWIIPLVFFIFITLFFFFARRGWRRISTPMQDFMDASENIANGDYSVRVNLKGPRELRRVGESFNQMAARLEIQNAERRNLLADVTHELRTPLTVIQGNLEGILDGLYQADEVRLRSMLEETALMARLIEDLRTLALAESRALTLHPEPIEIDIFLQHIAEHFTAEMLAHQVVMVVSVADDLASVQFDDERLHQVFNNLVRNALRYTSPGGSIHLEAFAEHQNDENGLLLTISDTGSGIAPQDLGQIFNRFYKSSDSKGMGLGLAIAKQLVEAHSGKITAESVVGQGTKIKIWLPIRE
jgi:two-component system OmpR family sensor kinase/two-component system sensor histidine kinase BaeS